MPDARLARTRAAYLAFHRDAFSMVWPMPVRCDMLIGYGTRKGDDAFKITSTAATDGRGGARRDLPDGEETAGNDEPPAAA